MPKSENAFAPGCARGDVLGRFSGNKFGLILRNCTVDDTNVAAERFLAGIRDEVVPTRSGPVSVTASIGAISIPRYARNADEAVNRAQETLDAAKRRRAGSFSLWRPNVERDAQRRVNIRVTDEIVTALNERRIVTAFEPVVEARSRQPAFYECLVRMEQADGRALLAPDIVPVAERLGLIRLVDHRVLELAVAELAASPNVRLSLNISPGTTMDPDWWTSIEIADAGASRRRRAADRRNHRDGCDPGYRRHPQASSPRLKNFGSQIAIDDFGAGYTSFRNLRKLGVDIVKIDGAFVQNIARSADDRAFVQTLIDLARRLQIETVAEWVQDEEAAVMLREWGCDYHPGPPDQGWRRRSGRWARWRVTTRCLRQDKSAGTPEQLAVIPAYVHRRGQSLNALQQTVAPKTVVMADGRGLSPVANCRLCGGRLLVLLRLFRHALEAGPACPSSGGGGRRCCFVRCARRAGLRPSGLGSARVARARHEAANIEKVCWNISMLRRTCSSSGANGVPLNVLVSCLRNFSCSRVSVSIDCFQIARHHHLHAVAVEADQLAQEGDRQQILAAFLVFLLEDDLRQHRAGDVLAGLGVVDDENPRRPSPSRRGLRASRRCWCRYCRAAGWRIS